MISAPQLYMQLTANLSTAGTGLITGNSKVYHNCVINPGVGSASGQADNAFAITGTVTAGTPLVINMTTLTNPVGSVTAVHLVSLMISNISLTGGTLSIGGGTNPIFASVPIPVSPGSPFGFGDLVGTSFPIASGSTQNLQITASTGTISFNLSGIVRSA